MAARQETVSLFRQRLRQGRYELVALSLLLGLATVLTELSGAAFWGEVASG